MRLRRSQLDGPGIRRVQCGKGFRYLEPNGGRVDDPTLARIRALVIPPAWQDVWICPFPNGHIQAIGTDAAGRRQYRYHDVWTKRREEEKFTHMVLFARCLPKLRTKIAADLRQPGLSKSRVLALGVNLLDVGMFRIGGEEYAEEHETYGLATIEKRHLRLRDGAAHFDYVAKGGKRRQITITDPLIVDLLTQLRRRRGGGTGLLAWQDEKRWVDVSSHELNAYLKERSGNEFSAKDFRTWDATVLAAVLCAQVSASSSPSAKKRCVSGIIHEVADSLGNTPAVCRRSYVDPRVFDCFACGDTIASAISHLRQPIDISNSRSLRDIEKAVINLIDTEEFASVAA